MQGRIFNAVILILPNQAALLDSLPETVVSILQDAIESGNKGILNWLFSHKTMRLISLMSLPCIIPADIAYATVLKVFESAPKLTYNIRVLSEAVVQLVAQTLSGVTYSPTYSAKLTCQINISEGKKKTRQTGIKLQKQ